ncbi:MAG: hypothetical protein GKR88_19390 [Flavobacteriaceae bacterium]|nr:MAG: hypothetical protein GKR88_19390 [Flavobacteriaceae bacterium]
MKNPNHATTVVYTNKEADRLIVKTIPQITHQVRTNAIDLAAKGLPKIGDPLSIYLPLILTLFQSLLEKVHKLIGAEAIASQIKTTKENYKKEEEHLISFLKELGEELRLLRKRAKELSENLGHIIGKWRVALLFLVILSFAETLLNYKIFLPISSNNAMALVGASGIALAFFIISHVFKDILNFFPARRTKILVGLGIVSLITALLYSFAMMRLAFISEIDASASQHVSEWNFVILNLVLFLAGVALTLIYKPSKKVFNDYHTHLKVAKKLKAKKREYKTAESRLAILSKEKNDHLDRLEGIQLMAKNYERTLEAEYGQSFALWCKENLIARKQSDGIPKCFSEKPSSLTTYFQNNTSQTL